MKAELGLMNFEDEGEAMSQGMQPLEGVKCKETASILESPEEEHPC